MKTAIKYWILAEDKLKSEFKKFIKKINSRINEHNIGIQ